MGIKGFKMKLALDCFSNVVKSKSKNLRIALENEGVKVADWNEISSCDGGIIYNIHSSVTKRIQEANRIGKRLISLQEGMYAINWPKTLPGMKDECNRANLLKIHQLVWSPLEVDNYLYTGKEKGLLEAVGNPEHDDLLKEPNFTRASYNIPEDAYVICHLCQYAHPHGGPTSDQLNLMIDHIKKLKLINDKVYIIHCLHPNQRIPLRYQHEPRVIPRVYAYPTFDVIRFSDLVITVSSTEAITAAILEKPLILYDISTSPERWPFSSHGVGLHINNEKDLVYKVKSFVSGDFKMPKGYVDYKQIYGVDGNSSSRVADKVINYFK